jgi:WD40 repeat protein
MRQRQSVKQIVSASWDKRLKLWDLAGNCLQTFVGHTAGVWSANFSLRLLSIEAETICLPSGLKFALQTSAVCPTKVCRQLPAKSQSLRLLSHEAETNLKLWDLAGNCLQTFVGHTDEVLSANFSPNGKQIV